VTRHLHGATRTKRERHEQRVSDFVLSRRAHGNRGRLVTCFYSLKVHRRVEQQLRHRQQVSHHAADDAKSIQTRPQEPGDLGDVSRVHLRKLLHGCLEHLHFCNTVGDKNAVAAVWRHYDFLQETLVQGLRVLRRKCDLVHIFQSCRHRTNLDTLPSRYIHVHSLWKRRLARTVLCKWLWMLRSATLTRAEKVTQILVLQDGRDVHCV